VPAGKKTIETLQATKNQSDTASLLRLSFDQVHGVMVRAVEVGLSRRTGDERYYYLSIDEKAVHRGHDYVSVLTDEMTGVVIGVEKGRTKRSAGRLCRGMSEAQRKDVKAVCTDMWLPFIKAAARHFPKALHCHDHFHLVGYLNAAVDKVRRREVKAQEALQQTRWLWRKDEHNFTRPQRIAFAALKDAHFEVARAWQGKENFRDIQLGQERPAATARYEEWCRDARAAGIPEITAVVAMFERHRQGLINAIKTATSNARAGVPTAPYRS
jgi:transposase